MGGGTVASFKAPEGGDQVWDEANRRIDVTGGDGFIDVFEQIDADHYTDIGRIPSAPGAETAILVPSLNSLNVDASPGEAATGGAVLRYDVTPRVIQRAADGRASHWIARTEALRKRTAKRVL